VRPFAATLCSCRRFDCRDVCFLTVRSTEERVMSDICFAWQLTDLWPLIATCEVLGCRSGQYVHLWTAYHARLPVYCRQCGGAAKFPSDVGGCVQPWLPFDPSHPALHSSWQAQSSARGGAVLQSVCQCWSSLCICMRVGEFGPQVLSCCRIRLFMHLQAHIRPGMHVDMDVPVQPLVFCRSRAFCGTMLVLAGAASGSCFPAHWFVWLWVLAIMYHRCVVSSSCVAFQHQVLFASHTVECRE
jgi:hypothetical protein